MALSISSSSTPSTISTSTASCFPGSLAVRLTLCLPRLGGSISTLLRPCFPVAAISGISIATALGINSGTVLNAALSCFIAGTKFVFDKTGHPASKTFAHDTSSRRSSVRRGYGYPEDIVSRTKEVAAFGPTERPPFAYAGFEQQYEDVGWGDVAEDFCAPPAHYGLYYWPVDDVVSSDGPDDFSLGKRSSSSLPSASYSSYGYPSYDTLIPSDSWKAAIGPSIITHENEDYYIQGLLSHGAYGRVYKAKDTRGQEVAIKVLHKNKIYQRDYGRASVIHELAVWRSMTFSSNAFVNKLLGSYSDQYNIYFIMRLCHGDLWDAMQREYINRDLFKVKLCAAELVSAVASLHAANIVHRDIKPANVLVTPEGHLALADYGLAEYIVGPSSVSHWSDVGTAEYMSPELYHRRLVRAHRAGVDIWAVGLVLYEIAMGNHKAHFRAETEQEIEDRILHEDFDFEPLMRLDPLLGDLVSKMLDRNLYARIDATQAMLHPYFADIDFERLGKRGYPAPISPREAPECLESETRISFESYYNGTDPDFLYDDDTWRDGALAFTADVYAQHKDDSWDEQDAFEFASCGLYRFAALHGWPQGVVSTPDLVDHGACYDPQKLAAVIREQPRTEWDELPFAPILDLVPWTICI